MASSGSFVTSAYSSRSITFNWWINSQSTSGNYTDIGWELVGSGGSTSNYYESAPFYLEIDGEQAYYSETRIRLYNGTKITSGTKRIYHNSDGTRSFTAGMSGAIYSKSYNVSGNGSWSLTNIPRYANITKFETYAVNETTIHINWGADANCDSIAYSIDGGSWVYRLGTSFDVGGLSANTQHSVKIAVKRTDSQLWTYSGVKYATTYDYPKPTSVNNFVIGNGASVTLYNPLGRNVTLDLISNNDGSIIGTYSGTYAGVVNAEFKTEDAINRQYASIPNSNSGTYYARVKYGAITKTLGTGTYSTNTANCSPSFNNFNVKDNNSDTVAITGNNQVFIKGYSDLYVTIPSSDKMTTQKSATPSSYGLSCDTLNKSAEYSTEDVNVDMGTITNAGTLRVNVRAYDSRSNSALAYKDITVYDYTKPVINIVATRLNNFENETTVKISGTYTRLTINDTDKNTIKSVKYRYREAGGTWSGWTTLTTSVVSGKFTCNDVILSLDNTKSFEFEVQATDNLDSNTNTASVDIGQAIFFVSSNKKACYINGQEILMYDVVDEW